MEPLLTEVLQIPAQPLLDPRASFTHPRGPAHAQRGLGSEVGESGVRSWWEYPGMELRGVHVPGCDSCSIHIVRWVVSHLCLEPSMAPSSLRAKAKVLPVAPEAHMVCPFPL